MLLFIQGRSFCLTVIVLLGIVSDTASSILSVSALTLPSISFSISKNIYYLPINAWFWGCYTSDSEGTIYVLPKQHYESIVPEKSGINIFSASLFSQIYIMTSIYRRCNAFDVILNKGRNSIEQNAIVSDNRHYCITRHYCFRVLLSLTNEYQRIYHVMH